MSLYKTRQKKYCKDCRYHWLIGANDGSLDNWCCKIGRSARRAIPRCIAKNYKTLRDV